MHEFSIETVGQVFEPIVRKVGRPMDATAESRILEAGLQTYAFRGWRGVTMSAIAKEAGVGKALLYSRFSNSSDILEAAFEAYIPELTGEFSNVRDLLLAETNRMADLYLGQHSLAVRRVQIDATAGVEPFVRIADAMSKRTVLPMRRRIHEAIADGELPPWTKVTQLLDVIEGAVQMHIFAAPHLIDRVRSDIALYNERLVDEQLMLLAHVGTLRGYTGREWTPPAPQVP